MAERWIACSFRSAAKMFGEEAVGPMIEVKPVLGLGQPVPLILVHDVLVSDPALFHGLDDLL